MEYARNATIVRPTVLPVCILDARREMRPSKARVQSLENTVAIMLAHMKASGVVLPELPGTEKDDAVLDPTSPSGETTLETETTHRPLPTPSLSTTSHVEMPKRLDDTPVSYRAESIVVRADNQCVSLRSHDPMPRSAPDGSPACQSPFTLAPDHVQEDIEYAGSNSPDNHSLGKPESGLYPCEARVAGVYHEHGCVSSVHGLAGIMNPTCRERHKENISNI